MSEAVVATGVTEVLEVLVTDVYGAALTGLTDVAVYVRRSSDGKLLDWNDSTFKSVGWTTRQRVLTETDATNEAGWYRYSWDTSTIVSPAANDVYTVTFAQTTLTNAANLPASGVIRTGRFVDTIATNLNATVSSRAATGDAMTLAAGAVTATAIASNAITSAKIATDAIGAAQLAADAVTEIQAGLASSTNVTDATTAMNAHTDSAVAPLALEATLTAMKGATFDGATDSLEALRNRGDAAWITATGFATPTNVSDAQAAVLAKLPAVLVGGRIDASVGAMQADVLTASALAASAVTEVQSGLATSAALATAQADITTIVGRVDVASSTLATSAALAAVATDATKSRRALWNRRALTSLGVFTLYADDAVTPLATATVTDKDGAAITLATGDAARTTALV